MHVRFRNYVRFLVTTFRFIAFLHFMKFLAVKKYQFLPGFAIAWLALKYEISMQADAVVSDILLFYDIQVF